MKLLINLCAQDGIISHNSGVGTIVKRYIRLLDRILTDNKIDYHINLFTPEYKKNGFGYSEDTYKKNINFNHTIFEISNGSEGKKFFGNIDNWRIISKNISDIINNIDFNEYDKVLTILNDPTFNDVLYLTKNHLNHIKVLIPHSTAKIYGLNANDIETITRIEWEQKAFNYINNNNNCYVAATGKTIKRHFINEYNCNKNKILDLINGEILEEKTIYEETKRMKELFSYIENNDELVISFGRPEKYKNLTSAMKLGKQLNKTTIIITQEYFKGMNIIEEYKKEACANKSLLYINEPFMFPQYILNHFKGKIIVIIPSEKEIVGLIINEVRKMNKSNILIVANDISPFRDQISDLNDGILVDINNITESALKITKYFDDVLLKKMNNNSQKRLRKDFDLRNNLYMFLKKIIGDVDE